MNLTAANREILNWMKMNLLIFGVNSGNWFWHFLKFWWKIAFLIEFFLDSRSVFLHVYESGQSTFFHATLVVKNCIKTKKSNRPDFWNLPYRLYYRALWRKSIYLHLGASRKSYIAPFLNWSSLSKFSNDLRFESLSDWVSLQSCKIVFLCFWRQRLHPIENTCN